MKTERILLFVYILSFVFSLNYACRSENIKRVYVDDITNVEILTQPKEVDTLLAENFIDLKINYYAPKSGSVNLVWQIENYPLAEAVSWNNKTKLTDGLLYTPMEAFGDTFCIQLKVPLGANLTYYFWILKNKQGHYQDFWDLQASGNNTVSDTLLINKNAIYSKIEDENESQIIFKGWSIFLLLVVIYVLLRWVQKKLFSEIVKSSQIEKVLFLGFSLIIFQALARAEIIAVSSTYIFYDLRILLKIIRGSFSDFILAGGLITIFILALLWLKNVKLKKLVYGVFVSLAMFLIVVAYTNIIIVNFLSKPLTFQWLYYSDFLGSVEAKTALQENLSLGIVLNLIAFCLSTLVLARILRSAFKLLAVQKQLKYISYILLGIALIILFVQAYHTKTTWKKGQSENAIIAMVSSMLNPNSNTTFFTTEVPAKMKPFDPSQSTMSKTVFRSLAERKVKNVLFIILESAGASYFDDYGGSYELSPNLNKFASHSLIFDQMYAYAPATNRTLVSILGSMYPYLSYKSITQEAPEIDHPTLSSVLKNFGYRTSFFSSANLNFQNSKKFLAHREFDRIEDFSMIKCSNEFKHDNYKEGNGIDDICLADRLTTWLEEDTINNFFSMIWTVQGHYPYFFANEEEDFGVSEYNFNRYLNCLKNNDKLIGEVMQILKDRRLDSTTLVVVTGDHGEAFGQHQQYGHGTHIYEENLKVPLYFINPVLFNGERKSDIAGMKDLASTTLSILDVTIPDIWHGRNLLNTNSDEIFFFAPWSDYLFGYRKGNKKYIFNESQNTVEVYDLAIDPYEKSNLYHKEGIQEEVEFARNRVAAWVQFQNNFVNEVINNAN